MWHSHILVSHKSSVGREVLTRSMDVGKILGLVDDDDEDKEKISKNKASPKKQITKKGGRS